MIRLSCKKCFYSFEVSEAEFIENLELYKQCIVRCGGENDIQNIEELIDIDIKNKIKENVTRWFNTLGIEGTIELIERAAKYYILPLYQQELHLRGVLK